MSAAGDKVCWIGKPILVGGVVKGNVTAYFGPDNFINDGPVDVDWSSSIATIQDAHQQAAMDLINANIDGRITNKNDIRVVSSIGK